MKITTQGNNVEKLHAEESLSTKLRLTGNSKGHLKVLEVDGLAAVSCQVGFSESFGAGLKRYNIHQYCYETLRLMKILKQVEKKITHRMGVANTGNILTRSAIFHGQDSFIDHFASTLKH